jgi:hypothetical protein
MGKNQDPGSGINIPNPQHCKEVPRNSVSRLDLDFLLNDHPDPGFFMTADQYPGFSEPKFDTQN